MLAYSVPQQHVKSFMHHLFKSDIFNSFETRSVEVHTFAYFEISGRRDGSENEYCAWGELQPYVFEIIKGNRKPRVIKIILSRGRQAAEELHPNAAALFLNITYESSGGENDKVSCTAAASQKNFEMDKQMDKLWESWVTDFFARNGIVTETV